MPDTVTDERHWTEAAYFSYGTQYYVAARFAVSNRLTHVAGQLFHHAIEFYLKGVLSRTMPYDDRKDLNHRLNEMWRLFKQVAGQPDLKRFDYTIRTLDWFRDLRYPDAPRALTPRTFVLSWVDDEPPSPESEDDRKFYLLAPSLIEELVRTIYLLAGADHPPGTIQTYCLEHLAVGAKVPLGHLADLAAFVRSLREHGACQTQYGGICDAVAHETDRVLIWGLPTPMAGRPAASDMGGGHAP